MATDRRLRIRHPLPAAVLLALMGVYFAGSLYLSILRGEELHTSNWDLGIFQQALWSTLHGHPMYEAGDWESFGSLSLLQVHPSFVLYLIVPFYALAPDALTLFVIQSGLAAAAAIPLYWIGLRVIGRPWPSLAAAGLYLGSAALLTANLYDFHIELFLPLEITSLFFFWLTGRYRLGMATAVLALLTLELAPFLVAFLALFFLLPPLLPAARRIWAERHSPSIALSRLYGRLVTSLRASWSTHSGRWTWALLITAIIAYPVIRLIEWDLLPLLLPPAPNAAAPPALVPAPPTGLGLALVGQVGSSLAHKLGFWLLMVGLFGFLPFLSPRVLILEVPWFAFTIQSGQIVWTTLGFQYTAIVVAPLAIASVYGIAAIDRRILPSVRRRMERRRADGRHARLWAQVSRLERWRPESRRRARITLVIAFLAVVALGNLAVGPANPANQVSSGPLPAYTVQYTPPPGYQGIVQMGKLIPGSASVLASSVMFPLVANDLNAYALLWIPVQPGQLPFYPGHPPEYLLLSASQLYALPFWIQDAIERHEFGLLAEVEIAPLGSAYLWQVSYTGPTTYF